MRANRPAANPSFPAVSDRLPSRPMDKSSERQFLRGVGITSLGTLVSRMLGLARDIATASLLGLGQGGIMDALVVALRIPNFARRVLGEGALAASFLPVFTTEYDRSPESAWRLLSALLGGLAAATVALLLLGELACLGWWWFGGAEHSLLIGLTATMLPYLVLICLAAQLGTALQGLSQFRWPGLAPALLNICWLAAAWFVAPRLAGDPASQAYVIAASVLIAGVLHCAVLVPPLRRAGFRFQLDLRGAWPASRQVCVAMVPIALGLAVTQINTLVDSSLAVALAGAPGERFSLGWFGEFAYPLETGAAAAIYYGERFYQLPVGLLGVAIATVVYPALSRHAARGDRQPLAAELTAGIRWVLFASIPASVGLILLAGPLMQTLFVRGAFTADDASRAAAMIACYASAAWAYCLLPILARGFYAVGDRTTPLRVGIVAVATDVALSLAFIGPFGERGLALSTALAACVQVGLLLTLLAKQVPIAWNELCPSVCRTVAATTAMAVAVHLAASLLLGSTHRMSMLLAACSLIAIGIAVYLLAARLLGARELSVLSRVPRHAESTEPQAMISRIG